MDVKALTLYAIWSEGKYVLKLDPHGETLKTTAYRYRYNAVIGELTVPERTNYEFQGWYYDDGRKFAPTDKMPEKDITLTARWSGFEYMIFFDAGKGKTSVNSITVKCGESVGELPKPRRSGYLFMGWYDGNEQLYTDKTEMPDQDVNLTARWKKVDEYASSITLKKKSVVLGVGMKYQASFTTVPEYTLDDFKWISDNNDIATVDDKGLISAKTVGTTKITVSGKNKSAVMTVKVEPMTKTLTPAYTSRSLKVGQKADLKVTYSGYAGTLKYTSSNSKTVSVTNKGELTAVGKGSAVVTVTAVNGVKTEVKITVS